MVPVFAELPLPAYPPADLYASLREGPGFLLESLEGGGRCARYSFICTAPAATVAVTSDGLVTVSGDPRLREIAADIEAADAVDAVRSFMGRFRAVPAPLPPFSGGLAGYFSYDLVSSIYPTIRQTVVEEPVARFMLALDCLALDHQRERLAVIRNLLITDEDDAEEEYARATDAVVEQAARIRDLSPARPADPDPRVRVAASSSCTADEFSGAVLRIKEHIAAGDILQAVLSRRLSCRIEGDSFGVYRRLRARNPSPYMFYLDFGDLAVAGSSPEMLLRVERGRVTTVPIAGTRPRGSTPAEDDRLAAELLADEKERAEHIMLVDLARNDIGAVSAFGSVSVEGFMDVERFSHVQHIASTVSGTLREGCDRFDALRSCFPAGTVSGAPKVRAMQVISEVEGLRRGIYAGAAGYIGFSGTMDLAIAIRTVVVQDSIASVQVGAGIVADSDPGQEWIETESKGRAMLAALGAVEVQ
ncbi:MAG TPA: anthranilate synthase component I family protein [Candidatus Methanoculleus thermohydrogenotrophicum]|nr:anthranilate synthase component I family protein [Candidatus Methanoculleus thermohydrogenotrophicum]HOB17873.1 anthranilate synthase component I family protein [Candidatus Methanoculleus thermohydrogenotrophicum]HPZ37356.1 anthranilate synthase component I family protein [Candidatus Methanoculleus thermohydrogenotrophicum]HQC91228.1 anthranilate synthase component I family protein [Candidatus Methanoculleus thermohydrogenotrophicum]